MTTPREHADFAARQTVTDELQRDVLDMGEKESSLAWHTD